MHAPLAGYAALPVVLTRHSAPLFAWLHFGGFDLDSGSCVAANRGGGQFVYVLLRDGCRGRSRMLGNLNSIQFDVMRCVALCVDVWVQPTASGKAAAEAEQGRESQVA